MKFINFKFFSIASIIFSLLIFISCNSREEIKTFRVEKTPLSEKDSQLKESTERNIIWDTPKGWIESSGSKMRIASFNVPHASGNGDLSVMILSGDGGGVEANINRWRAQIGLKSKGISEINKEAEKRSNILGQYQIFTIINNQSKEKAFLSAIIPSRIGTVFVKLTISEAGINEVKDDFIYFCDSFKLIDA